MALVGVRRALLSRRVVATAGGGLANPTTLNPSDKDAGLTLSGGNLVATGPTGAGGFNPAARSIVGKSSGKWYWEATCTAEGSSTIAGIGSGTQALDAGGAFGSLEGTRGYYSANGNKYTPAAGYGASYTTGDVIGCALDMDAGTFVCYKNGASQGTLVSSLTGTIYAYACCPRGAVAAVWTYNFGATAFAGTVPGGFNPGLGT